MYDLISSTGNETRLGWSFCSPHIIASDTKHNWDETIRLRNFGVQKIYGLDCLIVPSLEDGNFFELIHDADTVKTKQNSDAGENMDYLLLHVIFMG